MPLPEESRRPRLRRRGGFAERNERTRKIGGRIKKEKASKASNQIIQRYSSLDKMPQPQPQLKKTRSMQEWLDTKGEEPPRTRLAQTKLGCAWFPYFNLIQPDTKIISILKASRDRYRLSHPGFATSTEDLKKVDVHLSGGYHAGTYSFAINSDCPVAADHSGDGAWISCKAAFYDRMHSPNDQALFILLLEDIRIFHRLVLEGFHIRFPSIIICPPADDPTSLATRLFLKKVHTELKLPVLALGGFCPKWLSTLHTTYRHGPKINGVDLAVPDIKWLGLTPTDVLMFKERIPKAARWDLTLVDRRFIHSLAKSDDSFSVLLSPVTPEEGAHLHGMTDYCLMNAYLPLKLQEQDWFGPKLHRRAGCRYSTGLRSMAAGYRERASDCCTDSIFVVL